MLYGTSQRYIKFGLYLLLVVLINIAAQSVFVRWDLTENNIYSLSPVSKEVVASLSEPLTIKAFFSQELPPPYNTHKQYFRDILQEYAQNANQNFNYELIEIPAQARDKQRRAEEYGIQPMQVQIVEEDALSYKKVYMGAVFIHGDAVEKLPSITSPRNLEYKLTSSMRKLQNKVSALLALDKPVEIKLIVSSSLSSIAPAIGLKGLSNLPEKIRNVVDTLNAENYGKLKFSHLDPKQSDLQELVSSYDLQELQWPDIPDADISAGTGAIGLVVEHGDQHRTLSLLNVARLPLLGTQYSLAETSRIRELISLNMKSLLGINQALGYLAGHGTPPISPMSRSQRRDGLTLRAFQQLASENYSLQEVTLKEGIPEGLNCLVIAGAQEPFSDFELFQLDQALMRGTNLAIFQDSLVNTSPSPRMPPRFEPNRTGLEKLLNHYGLKQKEAVVMDENCYKQQVPQEQGGGEQPIYFAPLIKKTNINHQLPYLQNIKSLVAFKNSPVQLRSQELEDNDLHGEILFSSSQQSWTQSDNLTLNPRAISPPSDEEDMRSHPLAALVSGRLPSYFAGKQIPVQESKQTNATGTNATQSNATENIVSADLASSLTAPDTVLDKGQPGHVLLIGSASMLSDTVLDEQGQGPNSVLIMNLIDALNGHPQMAALRSKGQQLNPLEETSSTAKTAIKSFNIIGLPVLTGIFGLLVWGLRNRRKKRIQNMFE
jgi:ABC-type uncharacterized transport system involved in gliding motility auxiliary subunit